MDQQIIESIRSVASQLVHTLKTIYVEERVLEPLPSPKDYEHLRLSLYESAMIEAGFQVLGDYADRTLESISPAHEIRYRVSIHPNGAYLLQYIFDNQRVIEMGHFFESGGGISTSNAWASRHLKSMDSWDVHHVTPDKTWDEIWAWHQQRLTLAELNGLRILRLNTLEDFLKLTLIKLKEEQTYRQSIPGFVQEDELQAYLEQPTEIRERFYKELIETS